ncbi:hypothetical protein GOODEAATRI_008821, partial [Goodea atripinnis]
MERRGPSRNSGGLESGLDFTVPCGPLETETEPTGPLEADAESGGPSEIETGSSGGSSSNPSSPDSDVKMRTISFSNRSGTGSDDGSSSNPSSQGSGTRTRTSLSLSPGRPSDQEQKHRRDPQWR